MVSHANENLENNELTQDNKNNDWGDRNKYLEHCLYLCGEYFGGVWKNIDSKTVTFENLSLGFVNTTFVCSLDEQTKMRNQDANVPSKVIYKKYGNNSSFKEIVRECNSETEEALISQMLGNEGISPMLYGTFDGGRLEEFIEGKTLTTNDLKDKEIIKSTARKAARINSLKMPLRKSPKSLTNFVIQFILADVTRDTSRYDEHHQPFIKKLLSFELIKEGLWINEKIKNLRSSLIFTHNDLSLNNIMKVEGKEEKVFFVDFDTACYYYRGHELSYFLTFSKFDLKRENELPIVTFATDYDSDAVRKCFLQEYLDELNKLKIKLPELEVPESIEELDFEITFFELVLYLEMIAFAFRSIEDDKDNLFIGAESFCQFVNLYEERKKELIVKYPKFY